MFGRLALKDGWGLKNRAIRRFLWEHGDFLVAYNELLWLSFIAFIAYIVMLIPFGRIKNTELFLTICVKLVYLCFFPVGKSKSSGGVQAFFRVFGLSAQ